MLLTSHATTHGITGGQAKAAFNHLNAEGQLKWQAEDSEDLLFVDSKGEELPLADGVKSWFETDDAKIFQPPRGSAGSGDDPRRGQGVNSKRSPFDIPRGEVARLVMLEQPELHVHPALQVGLGDLFIDPCS